MDEPQVQVDWPAVLPQAFLTGLSDGAQPGRDANRAWLVEQINQHARRLGTPAMHFSPRVVATGHQAWFWHPGILAKDIAVSQWASRQRVGAVHLVVDHDRGTPFDLALPSLSGGGVSIRRVKLASVAEDVPLACQPPVEVEQVCQRIEQVGDVQLSLLIQAMTDLPVCDNLAQQVSVILSRLREPWAPGVSVLFATDLMQSPAGERMLDRMLSLPRDFAEAYQKPILANPHAGIRPLAIEVDRVELPLWLLRWGKRRHRVYVDLKGSFVTLVDERGDSIDRRQARLAPRALLLTTLMRESFCDLFIHGRGGGIYDQLTDAGDWHGHTLAPTMVVSADVYLDFQLKPARFASVAEALWYRHHLPHNMDRFAPVDTALAAEKQNLLAHMNDDRDPARRAESFLRIGVLNRQFCQQHADLLDQAEEEVRLARQWDTGRRLRQKRDWPFLIYPEKQLQRLVDQIVTFVSQVGSGR